MFRVDLIRLLASPRGHGRGRLGNRHGQPSWHLGSMISAYLIWGSLVRRAGLVGMGWEFLPNLERALTPQCS
jgi:hypothetical protein